MHTLNDEIGYNNAWSPLSIDLKLVADTLKEVAARHDVSDIFFLCSPSLLA